MRGQSERYKFWFKGKKGMPSVTIDVHPKTIVASVDKGQYIPAKNGKEAVELGWLAIYQARDRFVELQQRFGIDFEIEQTGTIISKPHAGFVFHEDWKLAQKDTDLPGWHIDKSPEKELGPGWMEIETDNKHQWTPLEQGIQQLSALPEAMKELEKIGPLTSEVHSVLAHIQSGENVQNQVNQLIIMFGKMLTDQHKIMDMLAQRPLR